MTEELQTAFNAVLKSKNAKNLLLTDKIITISVVEADEDNKWHIAVNTPYRKTQFSPAMAEYEVVKSLRKTKMQYKKLMNAIDREIAWVLGEEKEK
jgi:predicted RNA-binding protein with RPS1 domain